MSNGLHHRQSSLRRVIDTRRGKGSDGLQCARRFAALGIEAGAYHTDVQVRNRTSAATARFAA